MEDFASTISTIGLAAANIAVASITNTMDNVVQKLGHVKVLAFHYREIMCKIENW